MGGKATGMGRNRCGNLVPTVTGGATGRAPVGGDRGRDRWGNRWPPSLISRLKPVFKNFDPPYI